MYARSLISQLAIFSVLSFITVLCSTDSIAKQAEVSGSGPEYTISALTSDFENNTLSIDIIGDTVPAFTVSERFAPFRAFIDIAGAELANSVQADKSLIIDNPVAKMSVRNISGKEPNITRFEIEINDTHDYKVLRKGNNIAVTIAPAASTQKALATSTSYPAITDFVITTLPNETRILLNANKSVRDYKIADLDGSADKPARMYIDIPDINIDELIRNKRIGTSVEKIRVAPRGTGARFVFDSSSQELFDYDVLNTARGLEIIIEEDSHSPLFAAKATGSKTAAVQKVADTTLDELIESSSNLLKSKDSSGVDPALADAATSLQDNFAFSGYNRQRISVDFYKIDIHNVFRLFRQITDLNIIVDEEVKGTLTLALNDVPWDFALDIILNLQDLEKEERYNTIVIYPKKKEFAWPERAEDNLSFEADVEVVEQEALIIEQSANTPEEVMKAKELIRAAQAEEKKENYENAADLYTEAIELWPANSKIYNRLSTIYLVNLGLNAKALFYAKKGLEINPDNTKGALYAAIAAANMQQIAEASEFFSQAISGEPPMKEALFSFASFNENNNQHMAALKLLDKYEEYYGQSIDTMLAKARIYDKIGEGDKATAEYQSIMTSGFQLRPDLKKYIQGRLAASNN